jgi:hypothetical protein
MDATRQKLSEAIANIKWKAEKRLRAICSRDPNSLAQGLGEAGACYSISSVASLSKQMSCWANTGTVTSHFHQQMFSVNQIVRGMSNSESWSRGIAPAA